MDHACGAASKKNLSPMQGVKDFILNILWFRFMIHFEFIFYVK